MLEDAGKHVRVTLADTQCGKLEAHAKKLGKLADFVYCMDLGEIAGIVSVPGVASSSARGPSICARPI